VQRVKVIVARVTTFDIRRYGIHFGSKDQKSRSRSSKVSDSILQRYRTLLAFARWREFVPLTTRLIVI